MATEQAQNDDAPRAHTGIARGAHRRRVVIVGGGFGGLAAAHELRHADVEVTLVDRTHHHLFQPLLYQVAGGGLGGGRVRHADPHRAQAQLEHHRADGRGDAASTPSAASLCSTAASGSTTTA